MPLGDGRWKRQEEKYAKAFRRACGCSGGAHGGVALAPAGAGQSATRATYDISTLAGKSRLSTGQTDSRSACRHSCRRRRRISGRVQPRRAIVPSFVLSSPLDGTTVLPPAVTVNQDTAAAPQNETAIAVDPNNPNRIVSGANDYVTRTWPCDIGGTPCSALGDGYSGTYFSNDGGQTWCCASTDPPTSGTLIPGVNHLVGGPYDAGGDPALAFDSHGNVFYAGLGFDRTAPPNTVAVNRGTFDGAASSPGARRRSSIQRPPLDPERQGMDRGGLARLEPVPGSRLRQLDAFHLQPAERQLRPVADLLRLLDRRRATFSAPHEHLGQRALRPGFAADRRVRRDACT